jgi:hypothetical protein
VTQKCFKTGLAALHKFAAAKQRLNKIMIIEAAVSEMLLIRVLNALA